MNWKEVQHNFFNGVGTSCHHVSRSQHRGTLVSIVIIIEITAKLQIYEPSCIKLEFNQSQRNDKKNIFFVKNAAKPLRVS